MLGECSFVAIRVLSLYLAKCLINVKAREYQGIPEGVDAIIHPWCEVRVAYGYGIQLPIVPTNLGEPSFFGANNIGAAHSVSEGSITFISSIFGISGGSNSRSFGTARKEHIAPASPVCSIIQFDI